MSGRRPAHVVLTGGTRLQHKTEIGRSGPFMNRIALATYCLMPACLLQAGLVGDQITVESHFPNLATVTESQNFVVTDPGIEIDCPAAPCASNLVLQGATIDITGNSIVYNLVLPAGLGTTRDPDEFNGYVFLGLDGGAPITGVNFSQLGFTNLDASDVSFTANSVSINLQDTHTEITATWTIDLIFGPSASVPEPGTMLLLRRRTHRTVWTPPDSLLTLALFSRPRRGQRQGQEQRCESALSASRLLGEP